MRGRKRWFACSAVRRAGSVEGSRHQSTSDAVQLICVCALSGDFADFKP